MSATFSANSLAGIERLMRRPQRVMLAPDHVSLLGVVQYYSLVPGALAHFAYHSLAPVALVHSFCYSLVRRKCPILLASPWS